jgi:hypothetical protein
MLMPRATFLPCLAAASIAACGAGSPTQSDCPPNAASLRVVEGRWLTDTIDHVFPLPIVAEVRDSSGAPVRGMLVRFGTATGDVQLLTPSGNRVGLIEVLTGMDGRATARVAAGRHAGLHEVTVWLGAFRDSALVEIRPGNAVRFTGRANDTTLHVGESFTFAPEARDRFLNPVGDVGWLASSGLDVAGEQLTVRGEGSHFIVMEAGPFVDTAWVSGVPRGEIATVQSGWFAGGRSYPGTEVVVTDLTGRGRRYVATVPNHVESLRWARSANGLHAHWDLGSFWIPGGGGEPTHLVDEELAWGKQWGTSTADGRWVYFTWLDGSVGGTPTWRARWNGDELSRVTPLANDVFETAPAVSPDGRKLAVARAGYDQIPGIWTRELDTGTEARVAERGWLPQWMGGGGSLSYLAPGGALVVHRPSGTSRYELGSSVAWYTWSPDGRYAVYDDNSYLWALVAETGERIRLTWSTRVEGADPRYRHILPDWNP